MVNSIEKIKKERKTVTYLINGDPSHTMASGWLKRKLLVSVCSWAGMSDLQGISS